MNEFLTTLAQSQKSRQTQTELVYMFFNKPREVFWTITEEACQSQDRKLKVAFCELLFFKIPADQNTCPLTKKKITPIFEMLFIQYSTEERMEALANLILWFFKSGTRRRKKAASIVKKVFRTGGYFGQVYRERHEGMEFKMYQPILEFNIHHRP